jgi:Mrp family chromosome partitioning ATPase
MLEALRRTGGRWAPPSGSEAPPPARTAPDAVSAAEPDEVPFIEVGGPAAVEASAQVRAYPAAVGTGRAGTGGAGTGVLTPRRSPGPAAVAYQPLPAATGPCEPAPRRFAPDLIAFHQPNHPVSEHYRGLLAALTGPWPGGGPQVMMLASSASGLGTTTVILNLAITWARQGAQRVVVVDGNLRRPAVATRLGLPPAPGLREVVARSVPLPRALRETGQPGLVALTAGEALAPGGAWPAGAALQAVLGQLRNHFDWVLVDAPAWDGGPELVALGPACDAVYLVLRPADVEAPVVRELGRLIPHLGTHLGGYLLLSV